MPGKVTTNYLSLELSGAVGVQVDGCGLSAAPGMTRELVNVPFRHYHCGQETGLEFIWIQVHKPLAGR